jgi:FtsP/CotA-like multicopper oxidase with cupredoxin domain
MSDGLEVANVTHCIRSTNRRGHCYCGGSDFCPLEFAGNRSGQVHFLAYAENDRSIAEPMWLDTVNVPYGGSVDVIMDFTDPVIRGMSVFHCHLLNHQDKGITAKIVFE